MKTLLQTICIRRSFKFKLIFTTIFIASIVFQLLANGLVFAEERSKNQFTVRVVGQGKPVILIPGLMSDARVWQGLSTALAKHYQLHLVNLAGFGKTPAIERPSLHDVKTQLLSYIEQNKLQNPAVIGHSLGGFMAFWLASSQPDSIGAVISIDGLPYIGPVFTHSNTSTVTSLAAQATQYRDMYQLMSQQQLSAQSRYGLAIQATSAEAQAKVMAMIATSDPTTVGEAIYTLLSTDLRQDIANIKAPTMLLGASGGFDNKAQQAAAEQLYQEQLAALPKAKLKMNTQSRHFIMFDDPQWLNAQIREFLGATL
ncbi:alpha/beta fold hydrolase [Paraglaciecola sp.]|uniref:alpha/beta fold hydrolase n=1 Tax=Paraglaciecola sp. TaxID=1920173 RepID=UPI00273F8D0A|nr:alpha/beta hydrolase [Paraglaciecola sp.]MDP5029645.1 alpha/beta hydrolase [Paraglaciecola sp.]